MPEDAAVDPCRSSPSWLSAAPLTDHLALPERSSFADLGEAAAAIPLRVHCPWIDEPGERGRSPDSVVEDVTPSRRHGVVMRHTTMQRRGDGAGRGPVLTVLGDA
jgi:hypothetical protein